MTLHSRSHRPCRRTVCALLAAAALTALPAAVGAAPDSNPPSGTVPRLVLTSCKQPGIEREVRCGTFEVFEDRAARSGRKIPLRVVVLPATGQDRAPDPMFFFDGGPGQSAVADASSVAEEWSELNATRDIVLVDVRGTGASNGLQCAALQEKAGVLGFLESFLPVAGVRVCREALEKHADLRLYTTALAVDDVDDVRAALGYDRINLGGGSYGSFAAITYLRRHPEHVRTMAIEGVVPPNSRLPLQFARDAQTALDQVAAACAADAACHAAFPDVGGDVDTLLARLERAPVAAVARAADGERVQFTLSRSAAAQALRYMLYAPISAAQLPLQAHLAAQGDVALLAETTYRVGGIMSDTSDGFYLSVTCSESVPFFTDAEAEAAAAHTFLGNFRSRAQQAACAVWPRGDAADVNRPLHATVPVLLISGERDPVTPAHNAAELAASLPHALHVVVPGGAHGMGGLEAGPCLGGILTRFVSSGSERGIDTSCIAKLPKLPFMLADNRDPEVEVPAATLERYAGTYVMAQGSEFVVTHKGDHLVVSFGDGEPNALTPVSLTRFRVDGMPPGFFVEFTVDGERVTGLTLEVGPNGRRQLTRK